MNGFWMGHRMLGDVVGFCAAAHLYSAKIGRPVYVWFDFTRIDTCKYFDGVVWAPKEDLPRAVDCGGTPTPTEWPSLNGVKRFYRFMDPTLLPTKSFDVHFNRPRRIDAGLVPDKLIGVITRGNMQGEIDDEPLTEMLAEARRLHPDHHLVCFGCLDNSPLPKGVEDWRRPTRDISWIIEFVERLSLLITPQSGPCYIAAGWRVPMWVYRSRDPSWDWKLNYETYQVQRWWERKVADSYSVFDEIYRHGGWNGKGSGPGSSPAVNREYIDLLKQLIGRTPTIKTILDIGCGDWQIMRHVDLSDKHYLGVDVAASVIAANRRAFGQDHIRFQVLNPCHEDIPQVDLIIMKDVALHLPTADVRKILDKIARRCRWALIAHDYTEYNVAQDVRVGECRPINVLAPPFSFPGATVAVWNGKHVTLSGFAS